ncbi:pol Pro-Pol polyprotein-like 3 [Homarus americanus]|uniref:RNA-directed DNA polymerase n=1 Tax=Homarus americanus TaxID=6706 RepID=A0A8J5K368_HOMAM|nr:pol Pro-Pol polyprotein-like 3 [Homarus americanus]
MKGESINVANALSCILALSAGNSNASKLLRTADTGLWLHDNPLPKGKTLPYDTSTNSLCPIIPLDMRRQLFQSLHSLSHPGICATQRLVTQCYVWPSINSGVHGTACQSSEIQRHTKSPVGTFLPPSGHFDHVHVNIVGPLPPSEGFPYLLTIVNRFTHCSEAVPITEIISQAVAKAFVFGWVARLWVPSTVTTDRGRQLKPELSHQLMTLLGSSHIRTTAIHPTSNGLLEQLHCHLKAAIMARSTPSSWTGHQPLVLPGIQSAFKTDLGCSAAELVYGSACAFQESF